MTKRSIETKVAGVSFRRGSVERMVDAFPNVEVQLIPDPTNEHDPAAVRVEMRPQGGAGSERFACGNFQEDPFICDDVGEPKGQCANCGGKENDHTTFEHVGFLPRYNAETISPLLNAEGAGVSASLIDAGRMAGLGDMPWLRLRVEWDD